MRIIGQAKQHGLTAQWATDKSWNEEQWQHYFDNDAPEDYDIQADPNSPEYYSPEDRQDDDRMDAAYMDIVDYIGVQQATVLDMGYGAVNDWFPNLCRAYLRKRDQGLGIKEAISAIAAEVGFHNMDGAWLK